MLFKLCALAFIATSNLYAAKSGYMDDFFVEKITDAGSTTWTKFSEGAQECGFYTGRRCERACFLAAEVKAARGSKRPLYCWEVVWGPQDLRVKCDVQAALASGSVLIYIDGREHNCASENGTMGNNISARKEQNASFCSLTIDNPDQHAEKNFQCRYTLATDVWSSSPHLYYLDAFILRDHGTVQQPTFLNVMEQFHVDLTSTAVVECYVRSTRRGAKLQIVLVDQKQHIILAEKQSKLKGGGELRVSFANFSSENSGKFLVCRHRHSSNRTADSAPVHIMRDTVSAATITLGIFFAATSVAIAACAVIIRRLRRKIKELHSTALRIPRGSSRKFSSECTAATPRDFPEEYVSMGRGPGRVPIYHQLRLGLRGWGSNGSPPEEIEYEEIDAADLRLRLRPDGAEYSPAPAAPPAVSYINLPRAGFLADVATD